MTVTKDMTMGEILNEDITIAAVLMAAGMHCVTCPSSVGESLEMACAVHGLEVDPIVNEINEYLANKEKLAQ